MNGGGTVAGAALSPVRSAARWDTGDRRGGCGRGFAPAGSPAYDLPTDRGVRWNGEPASQMSLSSRIERLQQQQQERDAASGPASASTSTAVVPVATGAPARLAAREELLQDIRRRLQVAVISDSNALFESTGGTELRAHVESIVDRFLVANGFALTRDERVRLVDEVIAEVTGLGPLEPLLADETITEVMVNGPNHIYIERRGKISRVPTTFLNDDHVMRIIDRIITPLGRRIDQTSPRVDARLPDGSRVNCIIEPLSLIGPVITIRKFAARPYTVADLVGFGTATAEMFDFLRACVEARLNLFVSGGTGSGKTTTLNVISAFIPEEERIITIEDAAELQLRQEHVITLEARPANLEGSGEITTRDLLRNSLHMRPDRIIVGECRGGEALDMIQAMTVGQEGSLSTGHANSSPDMLRRLETMILMSGYDLPLRSIREQIASAVDLIVHTARLGDGSRKIVSITEVYGIEDDQILTQDVFEFKQTGIDERGKIEGTLEPTGIRPTFMPKFAANGIELPPGDFGIPLEDAAHPVKTRIGKGRSVGIEQGSGAEKPRITVGLGKAVTAGGMLYISSVGPVVPETGRLAGDTIRVQAVQCLKNLQARLEEAGSSIDRIVWANWCLRDPAEFEPFSEEWVKFFPGDAPVGQGTLMPPQQRRVGFRISIGVIAEAGGAVPDAATSAASAAPRVVPSAATGAAAGAATSPATGAATAAGAPGDAAAPAVPRLPAGGERRRADRRVGGVAQPPGGVERRRAARRAPAES
jgi:pilus assembly protein CpaF